jgi:hypothetical protein
VALVDGDEKNFEPNDILIHDSVQLIVASFPKRENLKWIEQSGQGSSVTQLVVKLWAQEELFLTGLVLASLLNTQLMPLRRIFLTPSDLSFKLLWESISRFGYNPRRCFDASSSVAKMKENITDLENLISGIPNNSDNIMELLGKSRTGGSTNLSNQ